MADTATKSAPQQAASSVPTVKYTGDAGVREITTSQWRSVGVEDQKTTVWSAENDYTVLASELSPAALEIIKRDRNLKISG